MGGEVTGFARQGPTQRRRWQEPTRTYMAIPFVQRSGFRSVRSRPITRARLPPVGRDAGYVDLADATYACNTTGSITLLATVAQNASVNGRIGKKAVWKSLQCRGHLLPNTTTLVSKVALIVVYDRRPQALIPGITDVLEAATPTAFNNTQNEGRFQILKRIDCVLVGNNTAGEQTSATAYTVDFFLDLKHKPVVFKAAGTGAMGDIEEGALYFITVGNVAAGTADTDLQAGFRVRFNDI